MEGLDRGAWKGSGVLGWLVEAGDGGLDGGAKFEPKRLG